MDVFGPHWQAHSRRIQESWRQLVTEEDVVLVPGDISWAMSLAEAGPDLDFVAALPGRKVIIKGNHDLWWDTITKVRGALPEGIWAMQNDHLLLSDGTVICGTRGWQCPDGDFASAHDEKIFRRETTRLALSLQSAPQNARRRIVMLHFPPTNGRGEMSPFVQLMSEHGVETCVYGHLHDQLPSQNALPDEKWGIKFHLVSADYLQFVPKCIYNREAEPAS